MVRKHPLIPFAILASLAMAPRPGHGAALAEKDPLPRVIENRSRSEVWTITVADKYAPVGIVKFYDMDNNPLPGIKSSGATFALNPGKKVKMAVCPSPRSADKVISINLAFARLAKDQKPTTSAVLNFSQLGSIQYINPSINCTGSRDGMWIDEKQLGNRIMEVPSSTEPFVIVGK